MSKPAQNIVAVAAARTPMGKFGGSFREIPVYHLGAAVIREALKRCRVPADKVEDVIFGCCRHAGNGTNPARSAARFAGLPPQTPAITVTMACASGLRSVLLAAQSIRCSDADVAVCGGMESMSTIPHLVSGLRWEGLRRGHNVLSDGWEDSRDPFIQNLGTGSVTEILAAKHRISREEQDRYAFGSHKKAKNAALEGLFHREIVPVPPLSQDETIRSETSLEKLSKLPPVFAENGTLTAGNSSPFADAAAALVLTRRQKAKELGAKPLFSLVSYAWGAVENKFMGEGPSHILPQALKNAKMSLSDLDFIELNEGFAGMAVANERLLKLDRSKLNKKGGAIALGHPVGASGARILVTLYYVLKDFDGEMGAAVIGAAGGVCCAVIIKRES